MSQVVCIVIEGKVRKLKDALKKKKKKKKDVGLRIGAAAWYSRRTRAATPTKSAFSPLFGTLFLGFFFCLCVVHFLCFPGTDCLCNV
jgi:hypothetical protein